MKKTLLALAALGAFAGYASAQTSVTMYGVVDAGLVREAGGAAGSVTKLTSGVESGSRLGFRGTEDLGGGLSAIFLLESGFQIDTGAAGQGGLLFGRQSYVGLNGGFGTVTLGRQYSTQFITLATVVDPFEAGLASSSNLMANAGRVNNTIKYITPSFIGFSGELAYGFGEVAGDNAASRVIGAAVAYASGPLTVRLGYNNKNNNTATVKGTENAKNTLLGTDYDFGVAKIWFGYGVNKGLNSSPLANANAFAAVVAPKASTDSRDLLLGVSVPFGASTLLASYIRKDDRTAFNQDADQWAVGYLYALSKRTNFYTSYARIHNKNGAGYTVGSAIEVGSGDKAFTVGLRHKF